MKQMIKQNAFVQGQILFVCTIGEMGFGAWLGERAWQNDTYSLWTAPRCIELFQLDYLLHTCSVLGQNALLLWSVVNTSRHLQMWTWSVHPRGSLGCPCTSQPRARGFLDKYTKERTFCHKEQLQTNKAVIIYLSMVKYTIVTTLTILLVTVFLRLCCHHCCCLIQ